MNKCAMIQAGEIQAIIGDDSRNGMGGTQYCGVWSLTSKHRPFNAFGNSYAGIIPSEMRSKSPKIIHYDDCSCTLERKADKEYPVSSRAEYKVSEPHYMEHIFTFADTEDMRQKNCSFRVVAWCSYINSPYDPHIYFLSNGKWYKYISPKHGVKASIAPSYISADKIEEWPIKSSWREKPLMDRPFYWDWHNRCFDLPFYYGRLDDMVLLFIFDKPRWLRFFCSPSGGGASILKGKSCPAWDFMWIIPSNDYSIGKKYTFRLRMVYKKFVSNDDIIAEYKKAVKELKFESV